MNRRTMLAVALAAGSLATAGWVVAQDVLVPNGEPNVAGTWTGPLKYKTRDMSGMEQGGNGRLPATLVLNQSGADLTGTLTLTDPEEGDEIYDLTGQVGNGNLWLMGQSESAGVTVIGKVNRPVTRLTTSGIHIGEAQASTFAIGLKKSPE